MRRNIGAAAIGRTPAAASSGGRQTGYERQHSDQNERALHSRLYRLVRIAQTMTWSK
jgi:hypothetical protein